MTPRMELNMLELLPKLNKDQMLMITWWLKHHDGCHLTEIYAITEPDIARIGLAKRKDVIAAAAGYMEFFDGVLASGHGLPFFIHFCQLLEDSNQCRIP